METHWGKYSGPLAAVAERWTMGGDVGDHDTSNPDAGGGTTLWDAPLLLTYADARYLREEFSCTVEELDALSDEMDAAQGIAFAWDSQGFLSAWTFTTMSDYREAVAEVDALNEAAALEEL